MNMKQKIAWFGLGILLGSFFMQILAGQELNRLYYEKERLRVEIYEALERLRGYEEKWNYQNTGVIQDIKVVFLPENENSKDSFTELELKKEVREIVKDLIGQETDETNPELVFKLLDNRIVQVEGKSYLIKVRSIIFAREAIFYLEAEHQPELEDTQV